MNEQRPTDWSNTAAALGRLLRCCTAADGIPPLDAREQGTPPSSGGPQRVRLSQLVRSIDAELCALAEAGFAP